MTDKTARRQETAEALLAAAECYVTGELVDLRQPTTAVAVAFADADPGALAAVLNATAALAEAYWQRLRMSPDNPDHATALSIPLVAALRARVQELGRPLDGQAELTAARQLVADLEQEADRGRDQLEQAVADGDIPTVLALRAEVEITAPGRLGDAQAAVLELELQVARQRAEDAADEACATRATAERAEKARIAAVEALRLASAEADAAARAAESAQHARAAQAAEVARLDADLRRHRAALAAAQQNSIRRLAGLAPAA